MKIFYRNCILIFCCLALTLNLQAQFQYISPVPGSKYHNPEVTIILRHGDIFDEGSLPAKNFFRISGSSSGEHLFTVQLAEEGKLILLKPRLPFQEGETVAVQILYGMKTSSGENIQPFTFDFYIREHRSTEQNELISWQMESFYSEEFGYQNESSSIRQNPPGLPDFSVLTNNNPAPGQIFFHNFSLYNTNTAHYCIIENNGDSVYGKFDSVTYNNFDLNHDGNLTAFNRADTAYVLMDSNYYRVKSLRIGNGYRTDVHDCQIFPDKRRYMMAYDPQIVDMTVYNPNYSSHATVIGLIIQELDSADNVLFQWRSWDHFQITDCNHINLAGNLIDYVHGNSIEKDIDGNIIISCRSMSEITKINRTTGAIMWRLGGNNNQFTFIGDPNMISWQHDVRRQSNGNLTVFDNGNYHVPQRSWAKEYVIDEVNYTATLVRSYSRNVNGSNIYSTAMGSVQLLPNGNHFICWGLTFTPNAPQITEVDPSGNVVWEMRIDEAANMIYRAHKYEWNPCARPTPSKVKAKNETASTVKIDWNAATNANTYQVQYRKVGNVNWKTRDNIIETQKQLKNLDPNTKYEYQVRSHCDAGINSGWTGLKTFKTLPLREEAVITREGKEPDVYPNPAHDRLQIRFDMVVSGEVLLSLYDLTGKLIYEMKHSSEGKQLITLDVQNIPAGMYLAQIIMNEQIAVKKIMIH